MAALDAAIATANHSPDLSDQITLCEMIVWLMRVIEILKNTRPAQEHTMALGKIASALRYECKLRDRMALTNKALQALAPVKETPNATV